MGNSHEKFMRRAIELADCGRCTAAPNPRVGAVLVHDGKIIGEGFHHHAGAPHAEANAIHAVKQQELLQKATLYVNLEPCNHFGKTPPCSDLIIQKQIPKVVIANKDSFAKGKGQGIEKLMKHGVKVVSGIMEKEGRELNRRFFSFHEKNRPYIILKFAKTLDGFMARNPEEAKKGNRISGDLSKQLVHLWRAEEQAILIGKNTAKIDNPELTCREVAGENPLRIAIDERLELPQHLHIFNRQVPTILLNSKVDKKEKNLHFFKKNPGKELISDVIELAVQKNILSLIVEGGANILQQFIDANAWDEARIFVGNKVFKRGIKAPLVEGILHAHQCIEEDQLFTYRNPKA